MTALDLMSIWPEQRGWSNDIGTVAILDGRSLLDAERRIPIEVVREKIGRRLHLAPRFRQLRSASCRPTSASRSGSPMRTGRR